MPSPLQVLSPLHKATRQIALHFEEPMARLDARGPEGHVLSFLRSYAPCAIGVLGRVFGWKRSTLTSMLDRLEARGLLERELDPEDRRSFLVRLTPAGRRTASRVDRIVRDFEAQVLGRVRPRDLAGFAAVMAAIDEITRVEVRAETGSAAVPRGRKET